MTTGSKTLEAKNVVVVIKIFDMVHMVNTTNNINIIVKMVK
jgi:hypothetical protein